MEVQKLIDEVEMWISRFCTITDDNDFEKIEDHLWKLIWMCIDELGQRYQSTQFPHNHLAYLHRQVYFHYDRLVDDYNSSQMRQWIAEIIALFANNFPMLFVIEWRPSDLKEVILCVSTKRETQNYVCFMQCLFPDSFQLSNVRISGNKPRPRFLSQSTSARLRMHYTWTLSASTYQRCLELFPAWPIVVHYGYDDELLVLISTFMIPDLARMCIMYLPTRTDYFDLVELPEKH